MRFLTSIVLVFALNVFASEYYYEYGKKVELTPVAQTSQRSINIPNVKYYKTKDGREIGIKNEIIVKLKKGVDEKVFFAKYNLTNTEHLGSTTYLLKLNKNQNIFTLSQDMHKDSDTIYAMPNRIQKYQKR